MDNRKLSKIFDKHFLKAIKQLPQIEGYYVGYYKDISKYIGCSDTTVREKIKKYERKNIIKTKRSFALFGTVNKIGIKILKDEA